MGEEQELQRSVEEIIAYIGSLEGEAGPELQELRAELLLLDGEKDILGVILNEKLDEILKETMQVDGTECKALYIQY
jgi:hypothetical protein